MDRFLTGKLARPRILIAGCGDVGMRILPLIARRCRVFVLTRQAGRRAELRAAGAIPILGDLDDAASLFRIAGLAPWILHLAPPQNTGPGKERDLRTRRLLPALGRVERLVYVSTTGVYGDCRADGGDGGTTSKFDETRRVHPQTARAARRVDAERVLRGWARRTGARLSILRVPGIYAADRLPLERLRTGTPALSAEDDVYTNHIHADDLARIVVDALHRAAPMRVYHATDDSDLKMGEYFDLVADTFALPRPPRLPHDRLAQQVSATLLSFMSESRRLQNDRIKSELGSRLLHATVKDGLRNSPGS